MAKKNNDIMIWGPNNQGHTYQPAPYHSCKARPRFDKTRWVADANFEFEIFNLADEHTGCELPNVPEINDLRWMNDDGSGLFSIKDQGKVVLGQTGERLAFFPQTRNEGQAWHGYPTNSNKIGDNLVDYWLRANIINPRIYRKLIKHTI